MKRSGTVAALAAMMSSLLTLACCLPAGFLAAIGLAGLAVFFSGAQLWLLGASLVFLGLGFWQVHRGMRCGLRPRRGVVVLLGLAAGVFLLVVLFPQAVASLLADLQEGLSR